MDQVPNLRPAHTLGSIPDRRNHKAGSVNPRHIIGITLWIIGLIILVVLAVIVHSHKPPWPIELNFTRTIQGPHPIPCPVPYQAHSAMQAGLFDVSQLNNPLPSVIAGALWLIGMSLLRLFRQALFFIVGVASVGGLFLLLTPIVSRPRPTLKYGICVHDTYPYFSFPSGHVSHDVVSSGFLLYITLSEPVRRWRYRWLLLPLQVFFVLDILLIGYSRLLEGDHWLFDVLGGYIVGALWLFLFIFLYRESIRHFPHERVKQIAGKMKKRFAHVTT